PGAPARGVPRVADAPVSARNAPTPARGSTPIRVPGANGAPVALDAPLDRVRLQVCSADKQIAERLAQQLTEATVVRVNLRDAGTPPPGEAPPIVLLDLRQGGVALDAISALRRAR